MKTTKRSIAVVLTILMLTACFSGIALAGDTQSVNINVSQDDLLDIVLTLGNSDSEVSTFADDLTDALVAKGVPGDNINITAVEASEVDASSPTEGWETYDHVTTGWNFTDPANNQPVAAPAGNTGSPYRHIWVYNGGQKIMFYGYDSPAYKDFMFMPNDDSTKKTFTFTMDDAKINNHSMLGGGFIFNANITGGAYQQVGNISTLGEEQSIVSPACLSGQYISGYMLLLIKGSSGSYPALYYFNNLSMATFHGGDSGMTIVKSEPSKVLSGVHDISIEVSGNTFKMSDTVGSTTNTMEYTGLVNTGSYGFGPVAQYAGHGCQWLSWFNFEDLYMETTSAKDFSEVIREPEWRDGSKRFIINAEDNNVADFSDPAALGEILARLGNEGISYIGWGKNANEADGTAFIAKNSGNGTFVNKQAAATDTYTEQIAAMANYIYGIYHNSVSNDAERLLYGRQNVMSVSPVSAQTNTADGDWPNGKWRVDQVPNYYASSTGTVPYDNLYLNNLDISFTETGQYKIYYMDELVKTVYVHRKPVAGFTATVDASHAVHITDNAYDPDYPCTDPDYPATTNGIASEIWKYKKTTDSVWTDGQPVTLDAGYDYIIMQTVTDGYGVASTPYYRYVTTVAGVESTPVAEFTVTPSTLLTYISNTISYTDTSYDPSGAAITSRTWKITKDGVTLPNNTGSEPRTDFTGVAAGTYKISLIVTNEDGKSSEEVARFLTIVRDTTDPIASTDNEGGWFSSPQTVTLTFSDEAGGSGFSHRYAVVKSTLGTPTEWGSMGTNSTYSVVVGNLGTSYIYYRILDYAGNEKIGYVGPFHLVDGAAPSAPTISVVPSYTDGTWTNNTLTVSASGSTDDFTAAGDIVYSYSTNGTDFTPGNSVELSTTGTHTVTFKVTDGSNNSATVSRTVKIDKNNPSTPGISMVSNGDAYTEGTWATHSVTATLSGGADTGGSGFSGYQFKIDDGSWQNGSSYTFNASGEFTIYYRAMDGVGNLSEAGSKLVKVDLEAPGEPTVSYDPGYTTEWTNKTITVTAQLATDNLTDPADILYEVSTDGAVYEVGNSIVLSGEGEHTVYFRVTDAGGNATTVSRTVNIDKTDPAVPDIAMVSGGNAYTEDTWTPSSVTFTLSGGADAGGSGLAGYQYKIGDGDWQNGGTYTLDASGVYTVRYRGYDNAGNYSDIGSKTVKVDLDAPETFSIVTSITTIDSIGIQAETTDALSGMSAYRVFDGTSWSDWQDSVDQTLTGYTRDQEVTLKVEAKDAVGNVRSAETTVSTLLNTAPTASSDAFTMKEDAAKLTLTLLVNDTDADAGDVLTVSQVSALSDPNAGTLALAGGVVSFKPAADWNGTVTFTYTAKDTYNAAAVSSVTLTATPVNDKPVAADDRVSTKEDTESTFSVLKNDIDIDSAITISAVGEAGHGTVTKSGSGVRYQPEPDYNGSDSFTYTVTDGTYESTATVTVTVESVNDEPVISADTAQTWYGQSVTVDALANDSDIDGDTLTLTSVASPQNGSARISDGKLVYTPASGFTGTDSFSYTATDGKASGTANVTVTVSYPRSMTTSSTILTAQDLLGGNGGGTDNGGNGSGGAGGTGSGNEGTGSGGTGGGNEGTGSGTGGTGSGNEGDGGGLTILSQPGNGTLTQEGGTVVYTPNEGSSGVDTYRVTLDENGANVEYLIATNTDPDTGETVMLGYGLPVSDGSFSVTSDGHISLDLSQYVEGDLSNATIEVDGEPVNGSVEIVDGKLVYTPADGFTGEDAVVVTISIDGEEVPYAIAFNVDEAQPLAVWWYFIIGGAAAAMLLWLLLARRSIIPVAEAVTDNGDGTVTIQWGYVNRKGKRKELDGEDSQLTALSGSLIRNSQTPPSDFEKGKAENVFTTVAAAGSKVQWQIRNRKARVDLSKAKF